jgi:hypothetical protein
MAYQPRTLAVAFVALLIGGCGRTGDSSHPVMTEAQHTHYHVHAVDASHEHSHPGDDLGGHTHTHQHPEDHSHQ